VPHIYLAWTHEEKLWNQKCLFDPVQLQIDIYQSNRKSSDPKSLHGQLKNSQNCTQRKLVQKAKETTTSN